MKLFIRIYICDVFTYKMFKGHCRSWKTILFYSGRRLSIDLQVFRNLQVDAEWPTRYIRTYMVVH